MIAVEHLTKRFGKNLVLDDISETIEQGEKVVIIGPPAPESPPSCAA